MLHSVYPYLALFNFILDLKTLIAWAICFFTALTLMPNSSATSACRRPLK